MSDDTKMLVSAIADMDEDRAMELASEMLNTGTAPTAVLDQCREAMDIIGTKFEEGEYFVPELILAGEMLEQISAIVKPLLKADSQDGQNTGGKVLIGTVHGDLHDIGKNIVTFMLDVNGFEVIDLGIDVPAQDFIAAIKEHAPKVVGLSGFLTLAFDSMKETIEAIGEAGLRDDIKIMIGGGQIDERICNYTGADAFGINAMNAVSQCKTWIEEAA